MRLVSTLSGGEKTRVALAIRLAISRMLMETAGTSYNFLILDEPPYLDSEGIDQLIQTISQLQDQFGQVLVVSHHPSLRQAFARTITVEKVDGVSRARVL
jgi:exonuclease SbcC